MKQLKSFKILIDGYETEAKSFALALARMNSLLDPEFKPNLKVVKLPGDRWEFHWDGYMVAGIYPVY